MCSYRKQWGKTISLLPTLTPYQRLRNCLFTMEILKQHDFYDKNNHAKFQGQKIHEKKSYLESTNIGSCCGKFITAANFDNLSKIELFFVCHEILGNKTSLC
jgi:hypothetical protein